MKKQAVNYQPWEKAFDRVSTPFEEFIHEETASGVILMACTVVALFLAKTGVLFASLVAGVSGYLWLRLTSAAVP